MLKNLFLIGAVIALCAMIVGAVTYSIANVTVEKNEETSANTTKIGTCNAKEYGNGVFALRCQHIGSALAELRSRYPNSVITFSYHDHIWSGYSMIRGYYVVINPMP